MRSVTGINNQILYAKMESELRSILPEEILARNPVFKLKGNRNHIFLNWITGSHNEICFRRLYLEIALHCESTPIRSMERRQAFDLQAHDLSHKFGQFVRSGIHENQGGCEYGLSYHRMSYP